MTNKEKAKRFLEDLPDHYKKLPKKDLKKLLMTAETHLHKQLAQGK